MHVTRWVAVAGLVLALAGRGQAQPFTCTELLGFSQTGQWSSTPEFQSQIDDARWQTRISGGAWLGRIADPGDTIWTMAPQSPCASRSATPDRVVLTATMNRFVNSAAEVLPDLRAAIATIRAKRPGAQIVLQPVVGGYELSGMTCGGLGTGRIRAAWNHPHIAAAIEAVLDEPGNADLLPSIFPLVRVCADYSDTTGHLDPPPSFARGYVGLQVGAWFAEPPGTTTSTSLPGACKLLGQNCAVVPCCAGLTCRNVGGPTPWRCR